VKQRSFPISGDQASTRPRRCSNKYVHSEQPAKSNPDDLHPCTPVNIVQALQDGTLRTAAVFSLSSCQIMITNKKNDLCLFTII